MTLTTYQGICQKMHTSLVDTPISTHHPTAWEANRYGKPQNHNVTYQLNLAGMQLTLHDKLGQPLTLTHTGRIFCIGCGRQTPKSYAQGFCYLCFKNSPQADLCMMNPHTCHHHQGTCRDHTFAQKVCFSEHIVYLANTSNLKVGITKVSNVPSRWLDQGAHQAIVLLKTNSRRLAGLIEHQLAQNLNDRTNWQKMLKNHVSQLDLHTLKQQIQQDYADVIHTLVKAADQATWVDSSPYQFHYPVLTYPTKIKSLNLDKTPTIQGTLLGIKGQYLLLDTGVINLRKFSGYEIEIVLEQVS